MSIDVVLGKLNKTTIISSYNRKIFKNFCTFHGGICSEEEDDIDRLREKYGDLFRDYDLSVMIMREYAIETWNDITEALNRYEYLKKATVELTQAIAAQFERQRKLRLAKETASILYYKNVLSTERYNREMREKFNSQQEDQRTLAKNEGKQTASMNPLHSSFDELISGAKQRQNDETKTSGQTKKDYSR